MCTMTATTARQVLNVELSSPHLCGESGTEKIDPQQGLKEAIFTLTKGLYSLCMGFPASLPHAEASRILDVDAGGELSRSEPLDMSHWGVDIALGG